MIHQLLQSTKTSHQLWLAWLVALAGSMLALYPTCLTAVGVNLTLSKVLTNLFGVFGIVFWLVTYARAFHQLLHGKENSNA